MARIAIVSMSDLSRDGRLDRQIDFLRGQHDVIACGLGPPLHADVEFLDLRGEAPPAPLAAVQRARGLARLLVRRHRAAYWRHPDNRRMLAQLSEVRFDLVVANDVSALPLAARAAAGRPLVFDAHEWAIAEQAEKRWWRLLIAPYVDALVRDAAPAITAAMTVSPGIAELYLERYGIACEVVTNAPAEVALAPSLVGEPVRLVHHGIAERARRIEVMARAVEAVGGRCSLDLMLVPGDTAYLEELRRATARMANVRVVEPVSPRAITRTLNAYDVGVYLLRDGQVNQRFALPNKFFEFVQARLAVIVGPSPEMARLVREHGFGVVTDGFEQEALEVVLDTLAPGDVERMKRAADSAAPLLSATLNGELVRALVHRALDA